jgi:DNA ligase-1
LLACYDDETEEYQSICKIGTGFTDQQLADFSKELDKVKVPSCKSYIRCVREEEKKEKE